LISISPLALLALPTTTGSEACVSLSTSEVGRTKANHVSRIGGWYQSVKITIADALGAFLSGTIA
jgi:hypothetical protein